MGEGDAQPNAVAVPAGNTVSAAPMHQQEKQGAKCCNCCCDYRRAVIIVAIVFIVLSIMTIIGTIAESAFVNTFPADDDVRDF